jgi:hypothetical protein
LYKTSQEFQTDIAGILIELEFMSRKKESTKVWKEKANNLESALNHLRPKFSSDLYPHKMLRLQLAATLATIHLALMERLVKLDEDGSYD